MYAHNRAIEGFEPRNLDTTGLNRQLKKLAPNKDLKMRFLVQSFRYQTSKSFLPTPFFLANLVYTHTHTKMSIFSHV